MPVDHDLPTLKALIFDVDGTLADTEAVHRAAFNQAFIEAGMDWQWNDALYTRLLNVSGGKERLLHYWKSTRDDESPDPDGRRIQHTIAHLHALKTAAYEAMVNDGMLPLRPGVQALIDSARAQDLTLAIATTTSPANIAALLRAALGGGWREHFRVIEDASTAQQKKPHPQVYLQALQRLQLPASACLAFEDSFNGLQAARAAGLATLITPTRFTAHHDFAHALRVLPSLEGVDAARLRDWHAQGTPAALAQPDRAPLS